MDPLTGLLLEVGQQAVTTLYEKYLKDAYKAITEAEDSRTPREEAPLETPDTKIVRPLFGRYVTRNIGFKEYVDDVRHLVQAYINKKKTERPLNILLAAPPGSGKSFFIKELIKTLNNVDNKAFEEVYIGSLDEIEELYGIFQRVQSLNLEGKLPFIFFDEIDAPIANQHVYAKFLAPMWDGNFYIGKDKFYLGRSIFFFAGSSLSVETESERILGAFDTAKRMSYETYFDAWLKAFQKSLEEKDAQTRKVPDFVDRLDYILRIPPIHRALLGEEDFAREHEDLACILIKKHFPQADLIEKKALLAIVRLAASAASKRSAEKAVFAATPSKDTIFTFECLPRRDREAFNASLSELKESNGPLQRRYYQLEIESASA